MTKQKKQATDGTLVQTGATGTVKWFNRVRGNGYIVPDDGGQEVFVHYTAIISDDKYKNLFEGNRVVFDLYSTLKGPQARNVRIQPKWELPALSEWGLPAKTVKLLEGAGENAGSVFSALTFERFGEISGIGPKAVAMIEAAVQKLHTEAAND